MNRILAIYGNRPEADDYLRLAWILNNSRKCYEDLMDQIDYHERELPPEIVTQVLDLDTCLNTLIPQEQDLQNRLTRREGKTTDSQHATFSLTNRTIPFYERELARVRTKCTTVLNKLQTLLPRLQAQVKRYEDFLFPKVQLLPPPPLMIFEPIPDDDLTFSESIPRLSREIETLGDAIPLLRNRLKRLDSVTRDHAIARIESDLAPDEREALGVMVYNDTLQGLQDQLNDLEFNPVSRTCNNNSRPQKPNAVDYVQEWFFDSDPKEPSGEVLPPADE